MRSLIFAALLLVGCDPTPEGPPGPCDPLDPGLCALPFPNSFFLAEDAGTPTGYRVDFRDGTLPVNRDDVPLDAAKWNALDGFSISGSIVTWFGEVSLDGLIGHQDLDAYAAADARTVIVDVETGARVPHFVELDQTAESPRQRLLMLRPVQPLDHARRYVVGIRGLVRPDGTTIQPSEAFASLRDRKRSEDPDVQRRKRHFDEVVFPTLEGAGFPRGDLLLAWDFVTASRQSVVGRMESIRDDLIADWGDTGPSYTVHTVTEGTCPGDAIGRTLEGTMTVPLFTEEDRPGTFLTRGEDGLPFANGTTNVPFVVRVPCSVLADPSAGLVVQYGHGLLGHRNEARTGWLSQLAAQERWIVVATDWVGMAEPDVPEITLMLAIDVSDFAMLPERSHQGYANQLALTRLIKTGLAADPNLIVTPDDGAPIPLVDPDQVVFYGNSQGGIMGGALMGMSPDLSRGALGVTGGPYNLLLSRSSDFDPFFLIFKNKYTDHRDIMLIMGLFQMLWDSSENAGWLHEVAAPAQGLPEKTVLIQNAIGDSQVTTLGGHFQARGYGAVQLSPETRPIFGVPTVEGPVTDVSVITEWNYSDIPDEPITNTPPDADFDTHECPRRDPDAQAQLAEFLTTGTIRHPCEGPCVAVAATCR